MHLYFFEKVRKNDLITAILLLGLIVIIVYGVVTIFGFSYNPSIYSSPLIQYPTPTNPAGYEGRPFRLHLTTLDPAAAGEQGWPVIKLVTNIYSRGELPLWNPYLAAGTPLAADTVNYAFSPIIMLYFLPNMYWDFPLLVSVWLAGIFTYMFLRIWRLKFVSCITGSLFYMFSGVFTWYLPHVSIPVIMFTPLILYSIEKIIQTGSFRYVTLGSVAILLSILGGHLPSIVLTLLLSVLYLLFRILYPLVSKSFKKPTFTTTFFAIFA